MTFWLVAIPVVAVLAVLVWWSSGRAKPDLRRRSIQSEISMREGSAGTHNIRGDSGPDAGLGLGGF
jgi:hypothetical protein